jgi:hypothetical protein
MMPTGARLGQWVLVGGALLAAATQGAMVTLSNIALPKDQNGVPLITVGLLHCAPICTTVQSSYCRLQSPSPHNPLSPVYPDPDSYLQLNI